MSSYKQSPMAYQSINPQLLTHDQRFQFSPFKLGYFKVNSIKGQFTFTVVVIDNGLCFKNLKYHPENIKDHNIIYCNVDQKNFVLYSKFIMDYISIYIVSYFNLNINNFKIKISKLMGFTIKS